MVDQVRDVSEVVGDYCLYKRRFAILAILSLSLFVNGELWISLPSLTPQLESFFNRTTNDINWFSNVFFVVFAIEAVPSVFFPPFLGLKLCIIIGSALNLLGPVFRVASVSLPGLTDSTRFYLCLIGSIFPAAAQGFILNLPTLLSQRWFGAKEWYTSTSVACASNILGVSIGFIFPTIVAGSFVNASTSNALKVIFWTEFSLCLVILFGSFLCVLEKPPTPPNHVEEKSVACMPSQSRNFKQVSSFLMQLVRLFMAMPSIVYLLCYGLYSSVSAMFYTFLVEMVSHYMPASAVLSGYMGSVAIIFGVLSTSGLGVLCSRRGDITKKVVSAGCFSVCMLCCVVLIFLNTFGTKSSAAVFVTTVVYGSAAAPYLSIGLEVLADVSYPTQPHVSCCAAFIVANVFSAAFIWGLGSTDQRHKYLAQLVMSALIYMASLLAVIFVKYETLRIEDMDKVKSEDGTKNLTVETC